MHIDYTPLDLEYRPGGSYRPDGTAWPTREDIFARLDRELSEFDKAQVQKSSEVDVDGCKLCRVGLEIRNDYIESVSPENRSSDDLVEFLVNPRFHGRPCRRPCSGRTCPKGVWRPAFNMKLEDGIYDLAMEYRDHLRSLPPIELPPEPPAFPEAEKETWIHFEKNDGEREYKKIVVAPPAIPHLEWACRVKKMHPSVYFQMNHAAFKRWFACLRPDERAAAFRECNGIASVLMPDHVLSGTIELHRADGSVEMIEDIPIPRVCFWIDDHRKWWDWERCFLACLISIFEWTGEAASCQWYEGWKDALRMAEDFLFRGMPEPDRRFWNLLHYEEAKIPEWGNEAIKQCADQYLAGIPTETLEKHCPMKPPAWPSERTEAWILFEKTESVYTKAVFLPPATKRFEWEWKVENKAPEKCIPDLDEAVGRWFASLTPVQRCSAWIECKGCERSAEETVTGEIELRNEDGPRWTLTPVPLPNVRRWIAKDYEFWEKRWRYCCCVTSLFEWEGTPERLEQVESFERARKLIEAYLMSGKLLPMDEIRQLHEEWDEIKVNAREQTAVDYAVEHGMIEIPKQILEKYFPKKNNGTNGE